MAKVISIKTGNELGGQDTHENEKIVEKEGRYLGVLPKSDAEDFRKFQDRLTCEQAQINELIEEFDQHYQEYMGSLVQALLFLGFDPNNFPFDPETERVFISVDGHMWAVAKKE
jgi:hypothetical protein